MNKIGILYGYWSQDWEVDYNPYLKKAKDLGFDVLEINTYYLMTMSDDNLRRFRDNADEVGIDVLAVVGIPLEYDVASPDSSIRKNGIDYVNKLINICAKIQIPSASGILYCAWLSKLEDQHVLKSVCWKNSISSMKEISKVAEDLKVNLNLEVVNRYEAYLLNTCQEALEYIDDVNSPNLYVHLDTYHMNIEEDSMTGAILQAGKKLGHFHIGENNRKPPGTGEMPWPAIFNSLKEIHYTNPIVMEPFVQPGGSIGRDINVYRDLMPGGDLNLEAKKSLEFVRALLA
jgi:D-psicose/D-tagatose/L-ribulose 3-epimerase